MDDCKQVKSSTDNSETYQFVLNQNAKEISEKFRESETMHAKIIVLLLIGFQYSFGNVNYEKNLSKTWKNSTFYAFRGIRYAETPVGPFRFKVSRIIFNKNDL